MKIIKFQGGLGNQMFQYAYAVAIKHLSADNVLADTNVFNSVVGAGDIKNSIHPFVLDKYNINLEKADKTQIFRCQFSRDSHNPQHLISHIIKEKQPGEFDQSLLNLPPKAYIDGYFQTEKYFFNYRKTLLEDLTLTTELNSPNQLMLQEIQNCNSVSLHIRRGDYIKLQNTYTICSLAYYANAIKYIKQHTENPHFFVFSDDIAWAKQNLHTDSPTTFVDFNTDKNYFDLELMRNCKHNIIANSSFSWWGAWLNNHSKKLVIAPEMWFTDSNLSSKDLIPSGWQKFGN